MAAPIRQVRKSCQYLSSVLRNSAHLPLGQQCNTSKRHFSSITVDWDILRCDRTSTTSLRTFMVKKLLTVEPSSAALRSFQNYCSLSRICWSCRSTVAADDHKAVYFCDQCDSILPPEDDSTHFERMECEQSFDINIGELTQKYRDLQRQLHPDKFTIRREREQHYSLQQSSVINKAYNTLLKPLSRGLYLLKLKGMSIEEEDSAVEMEFLLEIMELNEEVAEADSADKLNRINQENMERLEKLQKELSNAFSNGDYHKAKELLTRMRYYVNIEDKIKEMLMPSFRGSEHKF